MDHKPHQHTSAHAQDWKEAYVERWMELAKGEASRFDVLEDADEAYGRAGHRPPDVAALDDFLAMLAQNKPG